MSRYECKQSLANILYFVRFHVDLVTLLWRICYKSTYLVISCSGLMQWTGFYNLTAALGTIDKVLDSPYFQSTTYKNSLHSIVFEILMVRASFVSPIWRLPNIQFQPTMESVQVTPRKSLCTPLYLPPTPPSPVGVPQFHPNWMESLMYRRLASLYGCSVHWMIAHPNNGQCDR